MGVSLFTANLSALLPIGVAVHVVMRLNDFGADAIRGGFGKKLIYAIANVFIAIAVFGILVRSGISSLIWVPASFLFAVLLLRLVSLNRLSMLQSFLLQPDNESCQRMIGDFIQHNSWLVRQRAGTLRLELQRRDWADALESAHIARTTSEILTTRLQAAGRASFTDQLAPALQPGRISLEVERILSRTYPILWLLLSLGPITLLFTFAMPTFSEFFDEFEMAKPLEYLMLMSLGDFIHSPPAFIATLAIAFLGLFFAMYLGLAWLFPILCQWYPYRLVTRPYFKVLGLVVLAIEFRSYPDIAVACERAGQLLPVKFIAARLQKAANLIQQGFSPGQSLRQAGLLSHSQSLQLAQCYDSPSFAWAIEQLAESTVERLLARYSVASQVMMLITLGLTAILFGLIAGAVIQSLAGLIRVSVP